MVYRWQIRCNLSIFLINDAYIKKRYYNVALSGRCILYHINDFFQIFWLPPYGIVLQVEIFESNGGNFLSAGDLPLPALYTMMSLLFVLSAGFWCFLLRNSRHPVYKIHIIMCVLVFLKSLSLALHGVNYHFIQTRGEHVPAWAILYYITHLWVFSCRFFTFVYAIIAL